MLTSDEGNSKRQDCGGKGEAVGKRTQRVEASSSKPQ